MTGASLFVRVQGMSWSYRPSLDGLRTLAMYLIVRDLQRDLNAVGAIAFPLFRDFLVPFEVTSVLLLVAVIGAVVLAKRRV